MDLALVKLARSLFWGTLAAGILTLLLPEVVPLWLPLILAVVCLMLYLQAARHIRSTRRPGLRCPYCGWVPFALNAWKCKECGLVWDSFATGGVCPRCDHPHDEVACVRCRRIASQRRWRAPQEE